MFKKCIVVIFIVCLAFSSIVSAETKETNGISRGEFFNKVVEFAELYPEQSNINLPKDMSKDSPFVDSVKALMERNIVNGYEDGTVRVNQKITTLEASYVLTRLLGISEKNSQALLEEQFDLGFKGSGYVSHEWATDVIEKVLSQDVKAIKWIERMSSKVTEASSYQLKTNSLMNLTYFTEGKEEMKTSTKMNMDMDYVKDKGYYQKMIMEFLLESEASEMQVEQYIIPDGIYMNMSDPAQGISEWIKLDEQSAPVSFSELMEMQKQSLKVNNFLSQKLFFYHDLGTEIMDGKKLKKVGVYGNIHSVEEIINQLGEMPGEALLFNPSQLQEDMAMSINGVTWIDSETHLPYKQQTHYQITYGNSSDRIEMTLEMEYSGFNQLEEIILPEEAQNANE